MSAQGTAFRRRRPLPQGHHAQPRALGDRVFRRCCATGDDPLLLASMSMSTGLPADRQQHAGAGAAEMITITARAATSTPEYATAGRMAPGALGAETVSSHAASDPPEVSVVSWTIARSRLARAVQAGEAGEVVTQLRNEYAAARLAHVIRTAVPQLTAEQRAELAEVLRGGDADAA